MFDPLLTLRQAWSTTALCCALTLTSSCTGSDPNDAQSSSGGTEYIPPRAPSAEPEAPCATSTAENEPTRVVKRAVSSLPASSFLHDSQLPGVFPSAALITANATPLLDDLPGRVRMIAFWGEPGAQEPSEDTPLTFLGVDGEWRKLALNDLTGGDLGYLQAGTGTLSPDGSRWITEYRGWNRMLNFRTGELVKLTRGSYLSNATWSRDSRSVSLWQLRGDKFEVFDRAGQRIADIAHNSRIGALMGDASHITVIEEPRKRAKPRITFTTYDLDGEVVETTWCALPAGYPWLDTGADAYDGRLLSISALVDNHRDITRYSILDTATGSVTSDVQHRGYQPWLDQWVEPGAYMGGIAGAREGIYAADPQTGVLARISRITPYRNQGGYSNHAYDEFATDLVFSK